MHVTTITTHACNMLILHVCTMIKVDACTMIKIHACAIPCIYFDHSTCMHFDHTTCMYYDRSTCMYHDHNTCIASRRAHVPRNLRRGVWGRGPPSKPWVVGGGASHPVGEQTVCQGGMSLPDTSWGRTNALSLLQSRPYFGMIYIYIYIYIYPPTSSARRAC